MDRSYGRGEGQIWEENQAAEVHSTQAMQVAARHGPRLHRLLRPEIPHQRPTRKHSENISCPCGEPVRTSDHILRHCTRFTTTHLPLPRHPQHGVEPHPPSPALPPLLREGGEKLCKFLQDTCALSKPESGLPPYVPPNPTESLKPGFVFSPLSSGVRTIVRRVTRTRNSASAYVLRVAPAAAPCVTSLFTHWQATARLSTVPTCLTMNPPYHQRTPNWPRDLPRPTCLLVTTQVIEPVGKSES